MRGAAAGVFNVVRFFLALFGRRQRKGISPGDAPSVTEVTTATDSDAAAACPAVTAADDAGIGAIAVTEASVAVTDPAPAAPAAADAATDAAATATNATRHAVTAATAAGTGRTGIPQGRKPMSSGFDMQAEIAKLAERIIEPVAAKLTEQDLEHVVGQVRNTFEQLNVRRPAAEPSFEEMAVNILKSVQSCLTDAERRRAVDRLSGAMAAFCQAPGQRAA